MTQSQTGAENHFGLHGTQVNFLQWKYVFFIPDSYSGRFCLSKNVGGFGLRALEKLNEKINSDNYFIYYNYKSFEPNLVIVF